MNELCEIFFIYINIVSYDEKKKFEFLFKEGGKL